LFELWFDGGILSPDKGGPDVLPIFEKHQPDCLFYHSDQRRDARWGGSESGTVPYPCWATTRLEKIATGRNDAEAYRYMRNGDPDGPDWCPAMSDAPLRGAHGRHEWFWEPGDEGAIQPLDALVDMYYRSVGHNSTLILGLTPDPEGRMPDADTRRCEEFGDEIRRRFARPIAQTSGEGDTVSLDLPRPARIDHVICREDIRHGQRARAYVVEGLAPGNEWRKLCEGSSIGQKRIQRFEPVEVARIRLRVTRSIATPKIRLLAVHAAG
ncbi:MAG: glycoside hydrolase family 29, partial [Planctomycetes bacterium]|nr:glycoside hydrolase family 29 [Planctomycetota bacterium]